MAQLFRIQPTDRFSANSLIKNEVRLNVQILVNNEFFGQTGTTSLNSFLSNTMFQSGSTLGATNSEYSVGGTPLKNVNSNTLV